MSARCCKLKTARHQNKQTVAPKFGKTISHRIADLDTEKNYKISAYILKIEL